MAEGMSAPEIRPGRTIPARLPDPEPLTRSRTAVPARPDPAPAGAASASATLPGRRRGMLRPILFAALPVALALGAVVFVRGGQIMSSDNAYVQAQSLGVSTDVSGTVASVDVHDNQHVKRGQVLFTLRADSFRIALAGAEAQLGTVRNQVLTLQASCTKGWTCRRTSSRRWTCGTTTSRRRPPSRTAATSWSWR